MLKVLMVVTLVARNSNGGIYGGYWQSLHLAGVWKLQSGSQYADLFARNLASVALKIFSHLIYFIKKCYKFCTFNALLSLNHLHLQKSIQRTNVKDKN
jgi:hypothetical protein